MRGREGEGWRGNFSVWNVKHSWKDFYFFLWRIIGSSSHDFSDSFLFQLRRDALKLRCTLLEIHLLVHEIQIVDNKWKQILEFQGEFFQTFTKILRIKPGTFDVQSIFSAPALQSSYIVQHHMIITSRSSEVLRNFIDFSYSSQKLSPRHFFNDYLNKLNLKRTIQTPMMNVMNPLAQSWKRVLKNSLSEVEIFSKQETCKIYYVYTIIWQFAEMASHCYSNKILLQSAVDHNWEK